jgi:hypothetical protein
MDTAAGREHFSAAMEARRRSDQAQDITELPSCNWCVGSDQFRKELLRQMTTMPEHPYGGTEWRESTCTKAERILLEELKLCGWALEELTRRGKSDAEKLQIARRLRSETTMTWAWIA